MSDLAVLHRLVNRYRRKGVLVDTNLLISYLVGRFDPGQLKNCRATKGFPAEDFPALQSLIGQFQRTFTTPHILTEVSNLAGKLPEPVLKEFRQWFATWINNGVEEPFTPSSELANDKAFPRVGLTDVAIAKTPPGTFLVLTSDLDLYVLLTERKVDVVNFNHLRKLRD